jgi:Lrp/AsnC family leucine-responsive transcriptional regulator
VDGNNNECIEVGLMEAEITNFREYYDNKIITALIGVEADVNNVDNIGRIIGENKNVEEVFVVTGEYDLIIKVRFPDYIALEKFIVNNLNAIQGIRRSKTMMVLSIIKDIYMR